jgi:2-polyprenyl-3-methyl-5-hydroxy-6-metoxy-1,4-benzoquinol methylase
MDTRLVRHALGYWEVADKPSVAQLQAYYADKYYQQGKGSYELSYTQEELAFFRAKLEQRLHALNSMTPGQSSRPQRTMLDVGCGEGYALSFFREHGWCVKGFDFSSAGLMSKNPDCSDALETGDVFQLLDVEISSARRYDVVWLQNVLEHVLDPIDLLHSLRKLVARDGVAVITVPNDCSIVQRAALAQGHIDSAFWVIPPDHLSYFDVASLESAARHTGWEPTLVLGDFPVDWLLFHPSANYVRNKAQGKAAHYARVQIENLVHAQPINAVVDFWAAAGKLGIGRNITAFLKPAADAGESFDGVQHEARTVG